MQGFLSSGTVQRIFHKEVRLQKLAGCHTGDEAWVPFYGIASKRENRACLGPTTRAIKSASPHFRARRECLLLFSTTSGLWQFMFFLLTAPLQDHIMEKQLCPKSSRISAASVHSPRPTTSSFSSTPVPTKQGP